QSTLTISGSTFSGNSGDGIDSLSSGSTVTVIASTFSGNSGDGLYNYYGMVTVIANTFSGNSGAGIHTFAGTLHARNTIIAGNTGASDVDGNLGSQGHNLVGNAPRGSGFDPTDLLNVNPLLGPLQDNGGSTKTMALLPGSPALNAGDSSLLGV